MSVLKADTIQSTGGGAATLTKQSAAKMFVNLTGTGTIANNKSLNVSSVTDNASGDYTFTFTSSFDDGEYAVAGMCRSNASGEADDDLRVVMAGNSVTGSLRVGTTYANSAGGYDVPRVHTVIHGDLA